MCLDTIVKIAQIAAYTFGGLSLVITALAYRKSNKVKRGEWLKSLYEKFYEAEAFKSIRREIEYDRLHSFLALDEKEVPTNEESEEKLVDYLNFFEFIASLQNRQHIKKEEVEDLFNYYFQKLHDSAFLRKYINGNGFENLAKVLNDFKQ